MEAKGGMMHARTAMETYIDELEKENKELKNQLKWHESPPWWGATALNEADLNALAMEAQNASSRRNLPGVASTLVKCASTLRHMANWARQEKENQDSDEVQKELFGTSYNLLQKQVAELKVENGRIRSGYSAAVEARNDAMATAIRWQEEAVSKPALPQQEQLAHENEIYRAEITELKAQLKTANMVIQDKQRQIKAPRNCLHCNGVGYKEFEKHKEKCVCCNGTGSPDLKTAEALIGDDPPSPPMDEVKQEAVKKFFDRLQGTKVVSVGPVHTAHHLGKCTKCGCNYGGPHPTLCFVCAKEDDAP
jgi:hypothetical protein